MAQIQKTVPAPVFESAVIDSDRTDGYWVETFHFTKNDRVPGVITYVPYSHQIKRDDC
jgi:hypothetical protein